MPRRSSGQLLRRTSPSCSSRATSPARARSGSCGRGVLDELLQAAAGAVASRPDAEGPGEPVTGSQVMALEVALAAPR